MVVAQEEVEMVRSLPSAMPLSLNSLLTILLLNFGSLWTKDKVLNQHNCKALRQVLIDFGGFFKND